MINLEQTMPNMDTIARIFLTKKDYHSVRQTLDEFVDNHPEMDDMERDFLALRPADKSLVVSLFPVKEQFGYADPGDFTDSPEREDPKPLTR